MRLLTEKNPYSFFFFNVHFATNSDTCNSQIPARTLCVYERKKRFWMASWMFLASVAPFFLWPALPNLGWGEFGLRQCTTSRKQETQTTVSLSPSCPNAFSKLSCCYKAINCVYKKDEVKACLKVNPLPCPFLFYSSLFEIYLLTRKMED